MKKLLTAIGLIFGACACALGGTACEGISHTHEFSDVWSKSDTDHWYAATCEHTDKVSGKAAHDWDIEVIEAPTHTEEGLDLYTCTVCGYEKNVVTGALVDAHEFSDVWSKSSTHHWHAATCIHTDLISDEAPHTGNWVITEPPTCLEEGVKEMVCTVCKFKQTAKVPAMGHSYSDEWSSDENEHWHASTCGHEEQTKDTDSHTFEDFACTVCGYYNGPALAFRETENAYAVEGVGEFDESELEIPAKYHGKPVVGILTEAFKACTFLRSVKMPDSIVIIGVSAFEGCTNLANVDLGEGVVEIYSHAFEGTALVQLTLPDSISSIGILSFAECTNLADLDLGEGIQSIGARSFKGSAITFLKVPDSVEFIGESAFAECVNLAEVDFGEGVKTIGAQAFKGAGISEVILPESVKVISDTAFEDCDIVSATIPAFAAPKIPLGSLRTVVITSGKNLPAEAFKNCATLTDVTLNDDLQNIGAEAFYMCTNISSIQLPQGVVELGESAFYGCEKLAEIDLGGSLEIIGESAFENCIVLESVILPDNGGFWTDVRASAFENCINLTYLKCTQETHYGERAFYGCVRLQTIDSSDYGINKMGSIGNYAFYGCVSLTTAFIPGGGWELGDYAFAGCANLESVTFHPYLEGIGKGAFYGCEKITEVILEDARKIGPEAFYGCTSLETVILGGNGYTRSIGDRAFGGCVNITTLNVGEDIFNIGEGAFTDCINIVDAVLSAEAVKHIPKDSLQSVYIISGDEIEERAFENCTTLKSFKAWEWLDDIGAYAFSGCTSLKSVVLPLYYEICEGTFSGCTSLESIYYLGHTGNWKEIKIDDGNEAVYTATIYFYDPNKPKTEGNFWHYDENGEIVVWQKERGLIWVERNYLNKLKIDI